MSETRTSRYMPETEALDASVDEPVDEAVDESVEAEVAADEPAPEGQPEEPITIPDDGVEDEAETPTTVVVGQGDVEVDCPGCGLRLVGDRPRPTAAWFCPRCDYPLFWVSKPPPATPPNGRARRRLPGTGGKVVLGAETCWHCAERNEPGVVECIRCAATLPKPVPPQVPVVREAVPVPMPVAVRMVTWPYVAAAACAGGAIAMAITVWVSGG